MRGSTSTDDAAVGAEDRLHRVFSDIDARDGTINAFISLNRAGALEAAKVADARRAAGRSLGPLDCVPVALKDNLSLAGTVTTGGHAGLGLEADTGSAGVAEQLVEAGAAIIGKTNLDEGALGAMTDNPHAGATRNPLDPERSAGGSSGGSAAAVAAGYVPLAIGTDTTGSVRIPAAYCGIVGLKPTFGAIGRTGLRLLAPSLDTIGILAASIADARAAFTAIAGQDPADADCVPAAFRTAIASQNSPLKVALIEPDDVEPAIADGLRCAALALARSGASIEPGAIAGWSPAEARKAGLLIIEAEAASALLPVIDANPERFGETFSAMVRYGATIPAPKLATAYATARRTAAAVRATLANADFIMMPTVPHRAVPLSEPAPANQAELTASANFAGYPAIAIPVPADDGGLPASVQLIGRPWSEWLLLDIAERLMAEL